MATSQPKAVVVGTGFGVLTHLRALRAAGFEVVALIGRDPQRTAQRAAKAGVAHGLTSLSAALALPGVEVVSVATPPHTHAGLVLEAIAAGKHVVCEKPFARDVAEARRMLQAAEDAGVVHLLGTEFRFATGQAVATRAVHAGLIGEPRLATFLLQVPILADASTEVPAWWSDAAEGGGWLGAYASHVIDQVRQMLGEIAGVSASLGLVSEHRWTAEDSYTVHFRTRSGVGGIMQSSAGTWGPPVFCSRIAGTRGTLWLEGDSVYVADRSGQRQLDVPDDLRNPPPVPADFEPVTAYDMMHTMGTDLGPFTKLFRVLRARMADRAAVSHPAAATFADGVAIQAVMDAIRRSHAERSWVEVGTLA
ncbi:MAG: Gfo/Idh/MocA family oxidoreductase [Candidatus Binatia bacterium]